MHEKNGKKLKWCLNQNVCVFVFRNDLGLRIRFWFRIIMSKNLLGLIFDKMSKTNANFDISANFQELAGIEHTWMSKRYWYMIQILSQATAYFNIFLAFRCASL